MKLTTENIKSNYLILIIKGLIVCLFIIALIHGQIETSIHWGFVAETGSSFQNYLYILKETSYFRPAIILLMPLIGIFINKKMGWILIQSYFYFLISNLVFLAIINDLAYITLLLINAAVFLFLLLMIILMNKQKISHLIYGIPKNNLIGTNSIAAIIGVTITIGLAVLKGKWIY